MIHSREFVPQTRLQLHNLTAMSLRAAFIVLTQHIWLLACSQCYQIVNEASCAKQIRHLTALLSLRNFRSRKFQIGIHQDLIKLNIMSHSNRTLLFCPQLRTKVQPCNLYFASLRQVQILRRNASMDTLGVLVHEVERLHEL